MHGEWQSAGSVMGVRRSHLAQSTSGGGLGAIRRMAQTIIRYVDHDRVSVCEVGTLVPPFLQPMVPTRLVSPLLQPSLQFRTQAPSEIIDFALTCAILSFIPSNSPQRALQLPKRGVQLWDREFLE
jgi:hypothetical protein